MNLAALLCIDSIGFIRYVWHGLHISDAYSSWEQATVVYAKMYCVSVFWSARASCLLPSVLGALLTTCSIRQFHVRFDERWTPKDITLLISAPPIVYVLSTVFDRLVNVKALICQCWSSFVISCTNFRFFVSHSEVWSCQTVFWWSRELHNRQQI